MFVCCFFFFKQKTAYEMRISDWSSDVCSSDLPEVVVVATGGLPNTEIFPGAELAASSWDILTGDAPVGGTVLLYDDNAAHPGLAAAETIAEAGATLEIVTPERFFAVDVGGRKRSDARRVGKEGVRTCRSRWSPDHKKTKHKIQRD